MATGRYYIEMASTLKNSRLGVSQTESFDDIIELFHRAFNDFEAVGHHRYGAVVQNNLGYLLLDLKRFAEAQVHLLYARQLFHEFNDKVRSAQVDDTLARLYLATQRLDLAYQTSDRAVATLEKNDEEALLAEALTTKGLVLCKLNRRGEAKTILEAAHRIADRCGDPEGAGRALLVLVEEMDDELNETEGQKLRVKLISLLKDSQQSITQERLIRCLELLAGKPRVPHNENAPSRKLRTSTGKINPRT
jgi:tetratricopeptide (TPR) repeat protein